MRVIDASMFPLIPRGNCRLWYMWLQRTLGEDSNILSSSISDRDSSP
jgi:hypothetical protein